MESITKSKLSEDKIQELLKYNFGNEIQDIKSMELKGGMFNSAYEVSFYQPEDPDPVELVLKVSPVPGKDILSYENNIMRTEVKVYLMLQGMDIPVPEIMKYDFGRTIISSDYFFMTKLQGEPWSKVRKQISKGERQKLVEKIGEYTAMIHSIQGNKFGYKKDGEDSLYDTWSDAFLSMVHKLIEDGINRNVKLPYQQILTELDKKRSILNEIQTPYLVDFDLWAGNVFLIKTEQGYEIEGLIDFERAFYGDPYADFISCMMIYKDVEKEREFINGYKKQSGRELSFSMNDRCRMKLYRIYLYMIMAIETYRYNRVYGMVMRFYCRHRIKDELDSLK